MSRGQGSSHVTRARELLCGCRPAFPSWRRPRWTCRYQYAACTHCNRFPSALLRKPHCDVSVYIVLPIVCVFVCLCACISPSYVYSSSAATLPYEIPVATCTWRALMFALWRWLMLHALPCSCEYLRQCMWLIKLI